MPTRAAMSLASYVPLGVLMFGLSVLALARQYTGPVRLRAAAED